MTPAELETAYPELFEAARFLRERAANPSDVRLRCITAADGTVIAGKLPPPDPTHWVHVEMSGPRPWDPKPVPVAAGYRGKRR